MFYPKSQSQHNIILNSIRYPADSSRSIEFSNKNTAKNSQKHTHTQKKVAKHAYINRVFLKHISFKIVFTANK